MYSQTQLVVFDCTCNTQNSLLLNQHNGDDAPQGHISISMLQKADHCDSPSHIRNKHVYI